jgi:hypothetical protein
MILHAMVSPAARDPYPFGDLAGVSDRGAGLTR